jgi:hypothetical protein
LTEITFVKSLEGYEYPDPPPILSELHSRYRDALRGVDPHPAVDVVAVPLARRP